MQIAIQGTFENGQIKLKSLPPKNVKTDVIVVFEAQENEQPTPKRRQAGSLKKLGESKGLVYKLPDNFNEL